MAYKINESLTQSTDYFYLKDGSVIRDLGELQLALEKMDNEIFSHHVTLKKNDFANWVKDIFKDKNFAERLNRTSSRREMVACIQKKLDEKKMDEMLNNILMIENAKKILGDFYPRRRIVSSLKRVYENV